tara:strand:+ start:1215 stop:2279 length:1065 start_codon:yes stop_codon:yes gene_type:complete
MTPQLRQPVTGRSPWKWATLAADSSWQFELESRHVDEIAALLKTLRTAKLEPPHIEREHVSGPALCELMSAMRQEVEAGYGVARVTGLPVEDFNPEDLETLFWALGLLLGQPVSQNSAGECIAHVVDRGVSYDQANARGYTTRAELVPHCDAGPDFTGLLCVHPSKRGGESSVASSMAIYNEILNRHPEYLDDLYRGFFHDLRGEGPTGSLDELTNHRIPVYSYFDGDLSCSFNTKSMEQANDKMGTQYSATQRASVDYILELAGNPEFRYDMVFQSGDIQFVNNHTILHSRNEYEDYPEPERKRRLLRMWIVQPECRSLDPLYADRFNTGPRGGIARRHDLGRALPGLSSAQP